MDGEIEPEIPLSVLVGFSDWKSRHSAENESESQLWEYTFFFLLSLFIYFERQKAHVWGGTDERERERGNPGRLHTISAEPDVGLELTMR